MRMVDTKAPDWWKILNYFYAFVSDFVQIFGPQWRALWTVFIQGEIFMKLSINRCTQINFEIFVPNLRS